MKSAIFCAVSGVAAARTRPLYKKLESVLPAQFPNQRIAFLGNPFVVPGRRKFPFPLEWEADEREQDATTRLLNCWKRLNQFSVAKLRPALSEYDIVITERFGLDAFLYAIACCDCSKQNDEAERMHHALVRMRVVEQNIPPPTYFIPQVDPKTIVGSLQQTFSGLRTWNPEDLVRFTKYEETALDRYFDPRKGQNPEHRLRATLSIEEMCEEIAHGIGTFVERRRAAA